MVDAMTTATEALDKMLLASGLTRKQRVSLRSQGRLHRAMADFLPKVDEDEEPERSPLAGLSEAALDMAARINPMAVLKHFLVQGPDAALLDGHIWLITPQALAQLVKLQHGLSVLILLANVNLASDCRGPLKATARKRVAARVALGWSQTGPWPLSRPSLSTTFVKAVGIGLSGPPAWSRDVACEGTWRMDGKYDPLFFLDWAGCAPGRRFLDGTYSQRAKALSLVFKLMGRLDLNGEQGPHLKADEPVTRLA